MKLALIATLTLLSLIANADPMSEKCIGQINKILVDIASLPNHAPLSTGEAPFHLDSSGKIVWAKSANKLKDDGGNPEIVKYRVIQVPAVPQDPSLTTMGPISFEKTLVITRDKTGHISEISEQFDPKAVPQSVSYKFAHKDAHCQLEQVAEISKNAQNITYDRKLCKEIKNLVEGLNPNSKETVAGATAKADKEFERRSKDLSKEQSFDPDQFKDRVNPYAPPTFSLAKADSNCSNENGTNYGWVYNPLSRFTDQHGMGYSGYGFGLPGAAAAPGLDPTRMIDTSHRYQNPKRDGLDVMSPTMNPATPNPVDYTKDQGGYQ